MSGMPLKKRLDKPIVLSLPEELLEIIGSSLDAKDTCSMEMASTLFYKVLSTPSRAWAREKRLTLPLRGPWPEEKLLGPEAMRWHEKRIKRYTHISCEINDATMLETRDDTSSRTSCIVLPPLLPSLLAACASSAELWLRVDTGQGQKFLSMSVDSAASGAGDKVSSFWMDLKQHLTDLDLAIEPVIGEVQRLEALNMLTALTDLTLHYDDISSYTTGAWVEPHPYHNMPWSTLRLKLPRLINLKWTEIWTGMLTLSCPKLVCAEFVDTNSLRIKVEDAFLEYLKLTQCDRIWFEWGSVLDQLQHLESLVINSYSEGGGHLTQHIGQMRNLEKLHFRNFPAAYMPRSFPQSLQEMDLCPIGWCSDLPQGLKELHNLKSFNFCTDRKSSGWEWSDNATPLPELVPWDNLDRLSLGSRDWARQNECLEEVFFEDVA